MPEINPRTKMTDRQWEAQNGSLHPADARAQGLCWHCSDKKANWSAFGGDHVKVTCPECKGDGKARPQ